MSLQKYFTLLNTLFFTFLFGMLFFAGEEIFVMSYFALFLFVSLRTWLIPGDRKTKHVVIFSYVVIVVFQIVIVERLLSIPETEIGDWIFLRRFMAMLILLLPVLVSRYIVAGKYAYFYLPSVSEAKTIGIAGIADTSHRIKQVAGNLNSTRKKLTRENIKAVAEEISRNDSFNYINNGTLTDSYFEAAEKSLDDENIYLVISQTGSPASEIISVFTQKQYNHASLSFDRKLQTTISYNGGERVYPPGLNMEIIEFFNKSPDASILVYSLACPKDRKIKILEKIREINQEGSAYNMVGLVLKHSYKPNIMFCSQFVYNILDYGELTYFTKPGGRVSPTDLIELDYYKKLKFEKEIRF